MKLHRSTRLLALCLALVLATGCASRAPVPPVAAPPPPSADAAPVSQEAAPPLPHPAAHAASHEPPLEVCEPFSPKCKVLYDAAVAAAKYPRRQSISRHLQALIPPGSGAGPAEPHQVWNDKGQILMASWTKKSYYEDDNGQPLYQPGQTFNLYGDTWFTAVPEVGGFCRRSGLRGDHLVLRLEQLLGLPPEPRPDSAFLQVWIDPTRLFRPCPDPEISDHECQVAIPVVEVEGQTDCLGPCPERPPWSCAYRQQVSGRFVTVNPGHLAWMCQNWISTYTGEKKYPWTALGYTYDWGDPLDPRGPSEFVVPGGEPVVYDSITGTFEYCDKAP